MICFVAFCIFNITKQLHSFLAHPHSYKSDAISLCFSINKGEKCDGKLSLSTTLIPSLLETFAKKIVESHFDKVPENLINHPLSMCCKNSLPCEEYKREILSCNTTTKHHINRLFGMCCFLSTQRRPLQTIISSRSSKILNSSQLKSRSSKILNSSQLKICSFSTPSNAHPGCQSSHLPFPNLFQLFCL